MAKLIAEQVVTDEEHWTRVVSDVRKVEEGWRVFVCQRSYNPHDPSVNVTLDGRGQVLDYDKFRSLK